MVLSDQEREFLDTRPNPDKILVWKTLLAETYGGGRDEGNSNGTSAGGSTSSDSNTASAAVPGTQT